MQACARNGVEYVASIFFRGAGDGGERVAVLAVAVVLGCVQAVAQMLVDGRARHLGVVTLVPGDRQRFKRGLGVPPGVGDHCDGGILHLHDLLDARHFGDLRLVEADELGAEDRRVLDRGVEQPGELHVDREHLRALSLSAVSRRLSGLPAIFQLFGSLSLMSFGSGGVTFAAAAAILP